MKVRVNKRLQAGNKVYEPGQIVDLEGYNLQRLIDQRWLSLVEDTVEETPKRGRPPLQR